MTSLVTGATGSQGGGTAKHLSLRPLFVLLALLLLSGCPRSPGDACEASGSGFTRTDPCGTQCIDWEVLCADGTTSVPGVCAGSPCTNDPSVCATGWGCVQVNMTDSVCLPQDECPGGFGVGQPQGAVDGGEFEFAPDGLETNPAGPPTVPIR